MKAYLRFWICSLLVCMANSSFASWDYTSDPPYPNYTSTGTGSTTASAIDYDNESLMPGTYSYKNGELVAGLKHWSVSNGVLRLPFTLKKDGGGYFREGNSFKIFVVEGADVYAKAFNITNSATSSCNIAVELQPFTGSRNFYFYLITSDLVYKQYGGMIKITCTSSDNPPTISTLGASQVNATSAVLNGRVKPNGDKTYYSFYYGKKMTSMSEVYSGTVSASKTYEDVEYELSDLTPNTTYYFQLSGYNSAGSDDGDILSFTTESQPDNPGGDNEFETAVTYLHQRGIVDGSTPTEANTEGLLKRQQLAKITFMGVYGSSSNVPDVVPSDNYPIVYDLNEGSYYYRAARALLYLDYGDGVTPFDRDRLSFDPEEEMLRVYVVKTLLEAFNIQPDMSSNSNPFSGDNAAANLATNNPRLFGYFRKAYSLGIITKGRPTDVCTRGEAFIMLYRIMNLYPSFRANNSDYFEPLNTTLKTMSMNVGLQMGNFQHYTKTSFSLDGVTPLVFTHTYNSYNTTLPGIFYGEHSVDGANVTYQPLADGWSHSYHTFITLVGSSSSDVHALVHWGGGSIDVYKRNGNDWDALSMGVYDKLEREGSGQLVITTKSQVKYHFAYENNSSAYKVYFLKSIVDRNNNTVTISYESGVDGMPRINSVSDDHGRSISFSYRSGTNLISSVSDNKNGRSISFGYDYNDVTGRYQLKSFTDARNHKTYYEYVNDSKLSTSKLLAGIRLPNGNYVSNSYNESNYRLTKTENGESITTVNASTVYGSNGSSAKTTSDVRVTRSSGTSSYSYEYDSNNVMTKLNGPNNMNVSIKPYATTGMRHLPKAITTNSTNISNIEYDEKGNVTRVDVTGDDRTLTTRYEYNDMNDVTKVTDPMGYVTNYSYTNGNLTKIQSPISDVWTQISRLSNGLPSQVKDAEGVTVDYSYDSYGNVNKMTLPGSLVTVPTYDAAGRLTSIKDARGNTHTYGYDANDNLTSEKDPDNNTTTYEYDNNDNLTGIWNAKNKKTTLEYDFDTDWLTSVSFEGATKSYTYNADGTLDSYEKPDGTTLNYEYDGLGRVTNDGIREYEYDDHLRLSTITEDTKKLTFRYDDFNRVNYTCYDHQELSGSNVGTQVWYDYDANGNTTQIRSAYSYKATYAYDALNRMTSMSFNGGNTISYTYRKDSKLSKVDYNGVMTTTYGYDSAGRLTSKKTKLSNGTVIASYNYTLDKVGNIISQTRQEPYSDMNLTNEDVTYYYNSANRITKAGDVNFSFDANGNTIKRGNKDYTWNKDDRLTMAAGCKYDYDPLGYISQIGFDGQDRKEYIVDVVNGGNALIDRTDNSFYFYGATGLEARIENITYYYVTDLRGSVVAIVDENGNIVNRYQYDDFGRVLQSEEQFFNPFRYVGQHGVMYSADNRYYMRARFYDPTIGRFLSEDPIWSPNLYPYADNNPITGIDPEGLWTLGVEASKLAQEADELIESTRASVNVFYNDVKQQISNGVNKTQEELAKLKKDLQCYWDPSKPQCKGGNYPSQGLKEAMKEDAKVFGQGMLIGAVVVGAAVVVYFGGELLYGTVVAIKEGLAIIAAMTAKSQLIYLTIPIFAA